MNITLILVILGLFVSIFLVFAEVAIFAIRKRYAVPDKAGDLVDEHRIKLSFWRDQSALAGVAVGISVLALVWIVAMGSDYGVIFGAVQALAIVFAIISVVTGVRRLERLRITHDTFRKRSMLAANPQRDPKYDHRSSDYFS